MEKKTATKARHILGIGPIRRDSISHFFEATADWELAKKLAVNEFLEIYLQLVAYLIKGAGRLSSSTTVMRVGTRPLGVRTGGAENT